MLLPRSWGPTLADGWKHYWSRAIANMPHFTFSWPLNDHELVADRNWGTCLTPFWRQDLLCCIAKKIRFHLLRELSFCFSICFLEPDLPEPTTLTWFWEHHDHLRPSLFMWWCGVCCVWVFCLCFLRFFCVSFIPSLSFVNLLCNYLWFYSLKGSQEMDLGLLSLPNLGGSCYPALQCTPIKSSLLHSNLI